MVKFSQLLVHQVVGKQLYCAVLVDWKKWIQVKFLLTRKKLIQCREKDVENTIGVVFQEFHLFPHLSVLDNLILAPTLARKTKKADAVKEAERLLGLLDLADKANSMPYQLSGGQKTTGRDCQSACDESQSAAI